MRPLHKNGHNLHIYMCVPYINIVFFFVDFVAQKNGILTYFQVTADMTNEATFKREMTPLENIKDNYEKIVLTLDKFSVGNYEGIKVINLIDWLLEKK